MTADRPDQHQHMIDCQSRDRNGVSDLMRWSFEGVPEAVRHLIEIGAGIDERSCSGSTALFYAVRGESVTVVKTLLSLGADPNIRNLDEWTPLLVAAHRVRPSNVDASIEIFRALINGGADPNSRLADQTTPLMLAAHWRVKEAVDELISLGGDPTLTDASGHGIAYHAEAGWRRGKNAVVKYFRGLEASLSPARPQNSGRSIQSQAEILVSDR
jgi:ankyrin repeat protein